MKLKNIVGVFAIVGLAYLFFEGLPQIQDLNFKEDNSINLSNYHSIEINDKIDTLTIASFNIQTFGQTKSSRPEVMKILADIACNIDILAIQEIRDKSGETPINYVKLINNTCKENYGFVLSNRLGRSSSKESYLLVYDQDEVVFMRNESFVLGDPDDIFEREPFAAKFKKDNIDFYIISNHLRPDDAKNELLALSESSKQFLELDKEVLILGDLNADCSYFNEDFRDEYFTQGFIWLVPKELDTTTKDSDCTYDHMIVSNSFKEKLIGNIKVFDYDKAYNLDYNTTIKVSDHYPIWAEFNI